MHRISAIAAVESIWLHAPTWVLETGEPGFLAVGHLTSDEWHYFPLDPHATVDKDMLNGTGLLARVFAATIRYEHIHMKIGVLALQGAFIEHEKKVRESGAEAIEVRLPEDLNGLDGLIIPGGESTTIGKLAVDFGLIEPLRDFAKAKPTWGTCAGMIFLAKDIGDDRQPILGVMDIRVNRNAFGRQVDSFEADLAVSKLGDKPFHAIFIRAPVVTRVGKHVEVLATLEDGRIVATQSGHLLATAFHPELTDDTRFHQYFLSLVRDMKPKSAGKHL